MANDPQAAAQSMIKNLEEKTGKSMDQWADIVRKSGKTKHKERIDFLKNEHGMTYGYANLVVHYEKGHPATQTSSPQSVATPGPDQWFSGGKEHLRPAYDLLVETMQTFGADIEWAPKKTYMSVRRNKQFALLQPSTKTRLDVGIKLKGEAPQGRLEASGSFNSMVSHRVRIEESSQVDDELIAWLRNAYEKA